MWTNQQIKDHKEAARRLLKIKDLAFDYLGKNKNATELEVQTFLYDKFKEYDLKTADQGLIVAFSESAADPHYTPSEKSNRSLKNGEVVMIDIWARLNKKGAPYGDITWMGYNGKNVPKRVQDIFDYVLLARDEGIKYIKARVKKGEMPTGKEIDKIVRDYIHNLGHGDKFIHGTGHSLGFLGPHGARTRLNKKGKSKIRHNIAYTIEPGIYLENEFGVRSETDFYVSLGNKFILTAGKQEKIVKI